MKHLILYFVLCVSFVNAYTNSTVSKTFAQYFESLYSESDAFLSNDSKGYLKMAVLDAHEGYTGIKYEFLSQAQRQCLDDVTNIFHHLTSKWAIQMLDADGRMPSGILLGDGLWMGKYQECMDVFIPANKNGTEGGIHGLYCVATWNVSVPTNFHMPLQQLPIKTGLCLPGSCSKLDIDKDVKHIVYFLHRLPILKQYGDILNLNSLACKGAVPQFSASTLMFLYILVIYFSLVIVGSSVTVIEFAISYCGSSTQRKEGVIPTQANDFINLAGGESDDCIGDQQFLHGDGVKEFALIHRSTLVSKLSFRNGVKFLKCFCLFSNAAKILDTSSSPKNLPCIHGIRFLSMCWIILGHTYVHNINVIGNFMDLLHSIDNLQFQVIIQGTFSVDSFFLISGFLLGYLYLKESDKSNGKINWFGLCLHRFMRITPVYMLLIAFKTLMFKHTGSGPFWGDDSDIPTCKKYWWWNLLYINNFLPLDSMCVAWTWYLANDMQFFIFGSLLLNILWRWRVPGLVLSWTFLVSCWIVTWYISYHYDLIPLFIGMSTATDYENYKNRLYLTWDLIYTKPYCRIGPYLVGLLLAYFMHNKRDQYRHMKLPLRIFGWMCASLCSLSVVYGVYHSEQEGMLLHFYNALSRTSFSLGVAWVIYCCLTENGDVVNKILSFKMWFPLSRLTYCAYLFHPLIMSWYFESQTTPLYFTQTNMELIFYPLIYFIGTFSEVPLTGKVMLYFAFLVVSYAAAFVISITFEAPVINIEKILKKNLQ